MAGADGVFRATRILAGAVEAFAGQVYFAPEAHTGYQKLGFAGSPGLVGDVAMPDMNAYFCSRGAILGQVPGEVVASVFGVFNPAVVVPAVEEGWSLTTAAAIIAARDEGALGQLRRILGDNPDGAVELAELLRPVSGSLPVAGRPLYAGLLNAEVPQDALGAAWRFADRLREFRGDAHTAAWTSAGYSAVEIGLMTELYWGLRPKTYIRTRGWSEAELDAGIADLESQGLIANGALTDRGSVEREAIEVRTDEQCAPVLDGLGDGFGDAVALLRRFSEAVREARGYPAAGPHDLALSHSKSHTDQ
jgi:hypothetical protein